MSGLFIQPTLFSSSSGTDGDTAGMPPVDTHWVVDVVVEAEKAGHTAYTYTVPASVPIDSIDVGTAVTVPFGHQPAVQGFVLQVRPRNEDDPATLKSVAPDGIQSGVFSALYWAVLTATARYTVTPMARVVQAALPPNVLGGATPVWRPASSLSSSSMSSFSSTLRPLLAAILNAGQQGLTQTGVLRASGLPKAQCQKELIRLQSAGAIAKGLRWADAHSGNQLLAYLPIDSSPSPKTAKQQVALAAINLIYERYKQPLAKAVLVAHPDVSDGLLAALVNQGCVSKQSLPAYKVVSSLQAPALQPLPTLTPAQQGVVDTIVTDAASVEPWVLHGVTGSGKTAVYMHLIQAVLQAGKQALMLVPEITLTGQLAKRLQAVFPNTVVWHSNIAHGERVSQWHRIQSGEPLLIIGARSAALLPLDNVQLMVMDEAHDASFKQESPEPRYHAQWVCREWLGRLQVNNTKAMLVLGSATPDVGDMTDAVANNRLLTLAERYGQQSLATVEPVDLRQTTFTPPAKSDSDAEKPVQTATSDTSKPYSPPFEAITTPAPTAKSPETSAPTIPSKPSPLSPQTVAALQETLAAGQQAMVLINRRGYHTLIQCQGCGQFHQCPHCDVSLTLHQPVRASSTAIASKIGGHVLCHHCGYRECVPDYCPQCASRQLRSMGTGSQRVVETLEAALPGARIARLDRDVQQKRHAPDAILSAFANHQADILVGTQMIAKGLDIPNVTLVAVLQADAGLTLPDYRASERTFQLLTQVAGRAGRGALAGKVLVQTWQPEHPVMTMAMGQDYNAFYGYESAIRQKHGFPPYSQLFRFVIRSEEEAMTQATATALAAHARQAFMGYPDWPIQILGPAPCVLSRIQGWYRWHVLVKVNTQDAAIRTQAHGLLSALFQQLTTKSGVHVLLDVDSLSLL